MKLNKIFQFATIAVASATLMGVTSCNYLDVVPPEQPGLSDAMKNHTNALGFLHSCYNAITERDHMPRDYRSTFNSANDEYLIPEVWYSIDNPTAYAVMRNTQTTTVTTFWDHYYNGIGQTLLFDRELDGEGAKNEVCVDEEEYKMWKAESRYCRAFYHFELLRLYGPIVITNELKSMETGLNEYPGRTHFDGCVDWIVKELEEAEKDLPDSRDVAELNRATTVMCKALKSRVLLYAASPLWNGEFPAAYRGWKNNWKSTNPVTGEDYGTELLSREFNPEKWQRALKACVEALDFATANGFELYDPRVEDERDQLDADVSPDDIRIPGFNKMCETLAASSLTYKDSEGEEVPFDASEFLRAVYKLRYLNTTTYNEGNHEIIIANNNETYGRVDSRLPRRVLQTTSNQQWKEGWNGVSPTLYTVEHFLNADGSLPGTSVTIFPLSTGQFHKEAGLTGDEEPGLDKNEKKERSRVTNICLNREPRFYAWIGFDGGDYLTNLNDGKPCVLNMRDADKQGRGQGERNYSVTGFLSMKHVDPLSKWDGTNGTWTSGKESPEVLMRYAELILNVAECYAEMAVKGITPYNGLDAETEAIKHVNLIRNRAYVGPLTKNHLGVTETRTSDGKTVTWDIVRWVRNERFVELWDEGVRYFDVRRWVAGDEYFGYGKRRGLNGLAVNAGDNFLTPMMINSQYTFHYRQYLYPIYNDEVYRNPQMVQNPGF